MMHPAVQGNGYASEAVRAVIAYAFHTLGLCRVQARCVAENCASERVMQKSGMECEGLLRRYAKMHGRQYDFKIYAILRSDMEEAS